MKQLQRTRVSSLPAALLVADTRRAAGGAAWIAHRQRVFRVTAVARVRDWGRYGSVLERTADLPADALEHHRAARRDRLRVRAAVAGETVAEVLARGGGAWNGAEWQSREQGVTPDAKLEPGWPVRGPSLPAL